MLFCLWFRLWEEKGNRVGYIATQQSADWILPVPPSASSSSFPFLPFSLSFLLFHWFPFLSLCLSFFLPSLYARSALAHFSCGSFGRDSVESSRYASWESPSALSLSLPSYCYLAASSTPGKEDVLFWCRILITSSSIVATNSPM